MGTEDDKRGDQDATMNLTPAEGHAVGVDPLIGRTIEERYELRLVLGEGGMGKVYLAEDTRLGRRVALKLMASGLTNETEFRSRFEREAVLQANLPHPQIIQIIDMGESPEGAFIVMEYSDGRSLSRLLRELGPLPLDRALETCEQILEVLDFAHGQKVVHRDLKPANILVEERPGREVVRLLDFGIAKLISADRKGDFADTLTKPGFAYGTLGYMAPEQARGDLHKVDHRVDIYAVGIMLHEMLTGEVPAPPESRTHPVRYAMWVAENKIAPLAESHPQLQIAEQVDEALQKALRRNPDNRYASAFAFRNAIKECRQTALAPTVASNVKVPETLPMRSPQAAPGASATPGRAFRWLAGLALLQVAAVSAFLFFGWKGEASDEGDSTASALELTKVRAAFRDLGFDEDIDTGLASIRGRIDELEVAVSKADPSEAESLRAQVAKLRTDLAAAEAERDAGRSALAEAGEALEEKQQALDARDRELTRVKGELGTALKDLESLRKEGVPDSDALVAARNRIEVLQGQVSSFQEDVSRLETEKGELMTEKLSLERALADAGNAGQRLASLEQRLIAVEGERDVLARDKLAADQTSEQLRKKLGALEREKERWEATGGDGADVNAAVALLRKQLEDANRQVVELKQENKSLREASGAGESGLATFDLIIKNRFGHPLKINELAIETGAGEAKPLKPDDEIREITSGRTQAFPIPKGTTRVTIKYYRWSWQNKRWIVRPVVKSADVSLRGNTVVELK